MFRGQKYSNSLRSWKGELLDLIMEILMGLRGMKALSQAKCRSSEAIVSAGKEHA